MQSLLGFVKNGKGVITVQQVVRHDILPWLCVVALFAFINWAVIQLILVATGIHNEYAQTTAHGAISGYRLLIVGLLGCIALVRSKDWRLWMVFAVGVIWYFLGGTAHVIGGLQLPLLNFLLLPVAMLSLGRVAEYVSMRYIVKLEDIQLATGAVLLYVMVALGALVVQVL